jgi:hypothetical protein
VVAQQPAGGVVVDRVGVGAVVVDDVVGCGAVVLGDGGRLVAGTEDVVGDDEGSVDGVEPPQVTLTTVAPSTTYVSGCAPQPTFVAPMASGIAPAGMVAAGAGTTDSSPDTLARIRRPLHVIGGTTP